MENLVNYLEIYRRRDKLKILQWDTNGFWLHYRRLESGTFKWPMHPKDTV
ncbi:IS66 family insertion sequence element accessory protein TnpB, partial [Salinivibrio costicola]